MINNINMINNMKNQTGVRFLNSTESCRISNEARKQNKLAQPAFGGKSNVTYTTTPSVKMNTALRTPDEQKKFSEVSKLLDQEGRNKLNILLKNGRLLNNESNDKTTTLDNLYKIVTEKRAPGLTSEAILKDVVRELENPFCITQKFGDIPADFENELLKNPQKYGLPANPSTNYLENFKQTGLLQFKKTNYDELLNVISSSCVAASIQFNIAHKNPAEYARMAAGLSSENMCVDKKIKLNDIALNSVDAMWLLQEFNVPRKQIDWNNVVVEMKPDAQAIVRAQIQSLHHDAGERSPLDVLMQSTFMNIGSQHTYNSITDIRTGAFNADNRGLTDIEKNLAEVIAEGRNKISVTYQILDENGKLIGYECPQESTLKHITDALKLGENVIIGYTHLDENGVVENGHEITIIGIEKDRNGKQVFICNDTDDLLDEPVKYDVDYLLPKIHHAGLPHEVLKDDVEIVDSWVDVLNEYKNSLNVSAQASQPNTAA